MGKKLLVGIIKIYRKYISPLKRPCCKYYPTCSEYALQAVSKHGIFKGSLMAAWRLLRCNPFSRGGFDPVK
ncbi:MAG: membrane protein insertion efficiency factor YidD [Clostridiales bacterium]|jgi:putative membrane protein insertion efficiency factor|nr:membrane protein insertion efficiency factor YidD [Clostridiales bacterium]